MDKGLCFGGVLPREAEENIDRQLLSGCRQMRRWAYG